jgi:23S rRNA (pseudouridine1915-N3)-methyltransferase
MRITFLLIGKTDKEYLKLGTHLYQERISHYIPFQVKVLPDVKRNAKRTENEHKT